MLQFYLSRDKWIGLSIRLSIFFAMGVLTVLLVLVMVLCVVGVLSKNYSLARKLKGNPLIPVVGDMKIVLLDSGRWRIMERSSEIP